MDSATGSQTVRRWVPLVLAAVALLGALAAFCHLGGSDVVRHKIVQDIVEAYDRFGQQALPVEP